MDILCEEMGVSSSLMSYLKFHGIIDGRDEDYTYKILSRSGRILYLLKKIVDKGPEE